MTGLLPGHRLEFRAATDADIDRIVALVSARIGEEDGPEARIVLEDPDFDRSRWSVAVLDGEVVSFLVGLRHDVRIGTVTVPATVVEFVVTAEEAEGRGLVRRQLDRLHARAATDGELVQILVGIPYFYRRFGYEYAIECAGVHVVTGSPPMPSGWSARPATPDDVPHILRLQHRVQEGAAVATTTTAQMWHWLIASPVYRVVVAERDGSPEAMVRVYPDDDDAYLIDLAAPGPAGLDACLAGAGVAGNALVWHRPGLAGLLEARAPRTPSGDAYFVRVGDPVALLNEIRPELDRRLTASPLAGESGRGLISLYRSSISFEYDRGTIGEFLAGPPVPYPVSAGGTGIPPDLVASLLLGPHGIEGLDRLHPDVLPGEQRALMAALFPPQVADVMSWVVP